MFDVCAAAGDSCAAGSKAGITHNSSSSCFPQPEHLHQHHKVVEHAAHIMLFLVHLLLIVCRMGQVLLVDAPWMFKAPWEAIKPLLRKYAALVRFVSRQELAAEYFTPSTLPQVFKP